MQVLSVPLRTLLFCFDFVSASRIKSPFKTFTAILAFSVYSIVDVGDASATVYSDPITIHQGAAALRINNAGQVVGYYYPSGSVVFRAFLYQDEVFLDISPPGATYSQAMGINDLGQVVGWYQNAQQVKKAFIYQNGTFTDLLRVNGPFVNPDPSAINNLGQIVGQYYSNGYRAFIYQNGVVTDLGLSGSDADDINDAGQVVGYITVASGIYHAFFYENGVMTDLGTLSGDTHSRATRINSIGQVVGSSTSYSASNVFQYHAFLYQNNSMTAYIPITENTHSFAGGVNDLGQIAGYEVIGNQVIPHIYQNGVLSPIVSISGLIPSDVRGINNKGQVISGNQIWTPTPSNPTNPKNLGPPDFCPIGNPINQATGNKYQIESDYIGSGPFPLIWQRTYNGDTQVKAASLGANWRGTYDRSVSVSSTTATVYRPDGKSYKFQSSAGAWVGDADVVDRLQQIPTGWTYTTADDTVETYDSTGKLLTITNRAGLKQTLTYSDGTTGANGGYVLDANGNSTATTLPAGRLIRVTDNAGRVLGFGYDTSSRIVKVSEPLGASYCYGYNVSNDLVSVTYPDTKTRSYLYNELAYTAGANLPHVLTGITDENSARFATWNYDSKGRAISSEHAGGVDKYSVTFTEDGSGNPISSSVIDPLNATRTYNFQTTLGAVKSTGADQPGGSGCNAAVSNMTYDANGNVASRTDFNGNQTIYGYDLTRNLETSRTEAYATPLARTISTAWHPTFRLPTQIIEPGRVTDITYDSASGNMLTQKITDTGTGKVRQWTYTYTGAGDNTLPNLPKSVNGPRADVSDITTYSYYPNGDLQTITNAQAHTTQITLYDAHGRPLNILDPNNHPTTLTYWPRGWLKSRSVGTEITIYDYDGVGKIKKVTLPSGAYISYDYDDAHRLTDIWDQDNNRIHYTLDNMGNRIQEDTYDALGATVATKNRTFDALSRLYQEIDAVNAATGIRPTTTFGYDANGNQTWVLPPNQPATNHQYDALNRLFKTTDALLGITQYGYDGLDQLKTVTDPRTLTTTFEVNALGDQTKLTSPDTGITNKTYDAAGNLSTSFDARNKQTTYIYDALNRVTSMSFSSGTPVNFTYDQGLNGKGRLTTMTDESGATQWTYDAWGRVLTKISTIGGLPHAITYRYDPQGRLDQITYPSGKLVALNYLANKITSITANGQPVLSGVTYHPFGNPKMWFFGDGNIVNRDYDQSNRLSSYNLGSAFHILSYDDTGRISKIADSSNASLTQNLAYDNLDRLTSWVTGTANQSFGYDPNGNRTSLTIGATGYSNSIAPTSNRLMNVTGPTPKTYGYDLAGNIQTDGANTFNYNDRGRLNSVTNSNGTETYQINGLGQRVVKSGPLANVRFVYDESGHLIGEYTPSGVLIQETVHLGDMPVAVLK